MAKRFARCPNCSNFLEKKVKFCSDCGQKNLDYRNPFWSLMTELLEDAFNFDTQFVHTIKAFFLYPGKISADVVQGKRKRYTPPFRLFLFSSFLLVFLLSFLVENSIESKQAKDMFKGVNEVISTETQMGEMAAKYFVLDSLDLKKDTLRSVLQKINERTNGKKISDTVQAKIFNQINRTNGLSFKVKKRDDSVKYLLPILSLNADSITYLDSTMTVESYIHLVKNDSEKRDSLYASKGYSMFSRVTDVALQQLRIVVQYANPEEKRLYIKEHAMVWVNKISYPILFLLPLTTLYLLLLFGRNRKFYYEHFIFNIHLHTVVNIFNILLLLLGFFLSWIWPQNNFVSFAWLITYLFLAPLYSLLAFRRFYKGSWPKLLFKFVFFSMLYSFTISLGMVLFVTIEILLS